MQLSVYVNDTLYSDATKFESVTIRKEISGRVSTASVTFYIDTVDGSRYDEATYDDATYGVDVRELNEIVLKDENDVVQFAGLITKIDYSREDDSPNLDIAVCSCNDWSIWLEDAIIPAATFTGQTDRAILQALFGTYCPRISALTANISSTVVIPYFEVKDKNLRQAIEELAELTGGEWRVDYAKAFHYFDGDAAPAAPFGLSTSPNEATTFGYNLSDYSRDFIRRVNRCTVLGGILPGGTEINVTYEDPVSIAEYGVQATTIIDREITLASVALMRAQAEVEQYAYPQISGSIRQWRDGLDVGQLLPIIHDDYALNDSYLVRSLELHWTTKTDVEYSVEFGAQRRGVDRLLRRLEAQLRRPTAVPTAIPVYGTVTNDSLGEAISTSNLSGEINASGNVAINADALFGAVSAGQDITISATVVAGTFTAAQGITVDADTLQGVITGPNIAVDVTTFQGVIVSSQVADDLIDRLSLFNQAFRPIPNFPSDPALPDPDNYPVGTFYYNTTSGVFRQNVAGSWSTVSESTAVSGKLEYYHIGTLKAGSIIGLIAAGQIDTVNAGSIIGTLTSANVGRIDVSALTGTLTTGDAARINVGVLQGSLASGMGASIAVSALTGTLTTGNAARINVGTLDGKIQGTQIDNLTITAANIQTLTITADRIVDLTLTGVKLANNTIPDSKIIDLSASKITAGTITATISITSPIITGGTITGAAFTSSGTNEFSASSSGVFVRQSGAVSNNISFSYDGISINNGGNVRVSLSSATGDGMMQIYSSSGAVFFGIDPSLGTVGPSAFTPAGYIRVTINGALREIPYR
jgi:hypothetical protein